MKKLLLCIAIITNNLTYAQTPSWQWAVSEGRYTSHDYCNRLCTDLQGYSFATGEFQDTIDIGNITLINSGNYGNLMYISKYDASGNVVWAIAPGGNHRSTGYSICTDNNGYIYVTGTFSGTIDFGVATFSQTGVDNFFVAKYDTSGHAIWARNANCNGFQDYGKCVCVDKEGNVFVTGSYADSSITFGNIIVPNTGSAIIGTDIFIVKYDQNGIELWANGIGGTQINNSNWITADNNGDIYITGDFKNSISFGAITLNSANGAAGVFTVKYGTYGNVKWASSSGGFPSSGYGMSVGTDDYGNCYVTGYFNSAIIIFDNDTLTNVGVNDIFILKYDSTGNIVWANNYGSNNFDEGLAITTEKNGSSYVTGFFRDLLHIGTYTLFGSGTEMFVVKINNAGNVQWAVQSNGSLNERGNGIALDGNNNIYVGGSFSSPTTTFGSNTITNSDLYTGGYDYFVAKLNNISTTVSENIVSKSNFKIFPNPINQNAVLKFQNPHNEKFQLIIFDTYGREVRRINNIMTDKVVIEKKELSQGIYYFHLNSLNDLEESGKFIIE